MTTVTGAGFPQNLWGWFQGYFTILSSGPTGFSAQSLSQGGSLITITGTGLTYSFTPDPNNPNIGLVAITGGTITGATLSNGSSVSETFSNLSISGVAASNAVADQTIFNTLFFGGDDTFTWSDTPIDTIYGYDGNDTFNISHWGLNPGNYDPLVNGGAGTDTLNVTGGVTNAGDYEGITFNVVGVEQINLGAGANYNLVVGGGFVSSGNTVTIDASALGASNSFSFQSTTFSAASALAGNLVLIGGAGNDSFQAGAGANTFIGNDGSDTVSFFTAYLYAPPVGVTANLSISGFQSLGTGRGTASFSGIENLIGTPYGDVLTGDAGNNILNAGNSNQPGLIDPHSGNDVLNGGAGFDTAVLPGAMSDYTLATAGGTTTLVSSWGTATLTGIEQVQFDDQTMSMSNGGVTVSHAPVITTGNVSATRGQVFSLSSLFNIANPSQEAITNYQLWDSTDDPDSGYFAIPGVSAPARTIITITAAQLAQAKFIAGKVSDTLQIRALNAAGWSAGDNASWAPFTVAPVDNAPSVSTHNINKEPGTLIALSSLISVTDADGDPIISYQLRDTTSDSASGHWIVNGVAQPAGGAIAISAADASGTYFLTGAVPDNLQIRASDGILWSAADNASWPPFTVTPAANHPPVVTTSNAIVGIGQAVSVSTLFQVTDADGDAMTKYQLWISPGDSRGADAGYFIINNFAPPDGTVIDATAAQLASAVFVGGSRPTHIQIRAFDGQAWSAPDNASWAPFIISASPINRAPVVTASSQNQAVGATVVLSSLFSVTDADGDAITKYQLEDLSSDPASGYITINGAPQAAGTVIEITAAQLAQTAFVVGRVPDTLNIRAFDGQDWSNSWATTTVTPPGNHLPLVITSNLIMVAGASTALSNLFIVSDADGDSITRYQLWDATRDPNGGYFTIAGQKQPAGAIIDVSAAQLTQTFFVMGTVATNLQIRAFDGVDWSAGDNATWAPFTVSPRVNHAPQLTTVNKSLAVGSTVSLSSLFNISDADGDAMTRYQLWDGTRDPNSGYFTIGGTPQAAGTIIDISAAQLAQTSFVVGQISDVLQIRAFDGAAWSALDSASWAPFTVAPIVPVVTVTNGSGALGQSLALSTLVSATSANGAITKYQLLDTSTDPSGGYVTVNGAQQAAGTVVEITAAQLSQTAFVVGHISDSLQIRAFDGTAWSAPANATWASVTVSPPINHPPGVTGLTQVLQRNWAVGLTSTLIVVGDPDGDTITKYQLWDGNSAPNSGYFMISGQIQPARTVIEITAAQAAATVFVPGAVPDSLQVRAFDGKAWSAADNASWSPFTIIPAANTPTMVFPHDRSGRKGDMFQLSTLISTSDADLDPVVKYQLWDATRDPNSGYFTINGVAQPAGTVIEVTAAQAAQTFFTLGSVGDNLQIRVFDGFDWSAADNAAWTPVTMTVTPNHLPVVATANMSAVANQTLTLSSLFTVSDADGDSIPAYQLWDATRDPNSGHFVVGGVDQPAGAVIQITAAQLSQTSFVTGAIGDNLQIRAMDGRGGWSAGDAALWSPFTISIRNNTAPVVTTVDKSATAGQSFALSSLFSVSDADGDSMTKYQIWDSTADPSSGHFVVSSQTQSAGTLIEITAAQLSQTSFVAGASGHGDLLQIRAFDGYAWSAGDSAAWAPFHINV